MSAAHFSCSVLLSPCVAVALLPRSGSSCLTFFHSITVMNVDINVKHSLVVSQQLEDGEDDVVGVAEAAALGLFGVVQTAGPVDRYVRHAAIQLPCARHAASAIELAEVIQSFEDRAVSVHSEFCEAGCEGCERL